MALTVKVLESKPRVFLVTLTGSLDSSTYADLEKRILNLISEGCAKVITFDMAALDFISSMGVRVIFKTKKELAKTSGSLYLVHIPAHIQKVLEIIEALPSMKIFTNIQELDAYLAKMQQH